MCLLILIQGVDQDFPILVASNRDEDRGRKASPPGLFIGERLRMLSPRDRLGGGTWLAVNERGLFAGVTNVAGAGHEPLPTTRGALPHLALDHDNLPDAAAAVAAAVRRDRYNAFQLLLSDGCRARVLVHVDGRLTEQESKDPVLVLSNEHRLGELRVPDELLLPERGAVVAPGIAAEERLRALAPLLLDQGEVTGHRILKKGDDSYGTVSSTLIAVPREDLRRLIWRYAPGPPDETGYRSYGNLGKRLT